MTANEHPARDRLGCLGVAERFVVVTKPSDPEGAPRWSEGTSVQGQRRKQQGAGPLATAYPPTRPRVAKRVARNREESRRAARVPKGDSLSESRMREIRPSGSIEPGVETEHGRRILRHNRGNPETDVSRSLNHRVTPRLYLTAPVHQGCQSSRSPTPGN